MTKRKTYIQKDKNNDTFKFFIFSSTRSVPFEAETTKFRGKLQTTSLKKHVLSKLFELSYNYILYDNRYNYSCYT